MSLMRIRVQLGNEVKHITVLQRGEGEYFYCPSSCVCEGRGEVEGKTCYRIANAAEGGKP